MSAALTTQSVTLETGRMNRLRGFSLVELMVAITLGVDRDGGRDFGFRRLTLCLRSHLRYSRTHRWRAFRPQLHLEFGSRPAYMSCTTAPNMQGILNAGSPSAPSVSTKRCRVSKPSARAVAAYAVAAAPVAGDTQYGGLDGRSRCATARQVRRVQNNDVLVARSTLPNAQTVYVSAIVDGASSFTVNTQGSLAGRSAGGDFRLHQGRRIPNLGTGAAGANAVITHNAGGAPGNSTSTFPLSFSPGAQVTPVDTVVYYIGVGADGDGALWATI